MLGVSRALVVHGADGLDEITISSETRIAEVRNGSVKQYQISPEQFGLSRAPLSAIIGGDVKENARLVREVLEGKKSARRDVVLLNAAAALMAAAKAEGIHEGVEAAAESLDSGKAKAKLDALVEFTNRHKS